jgi:hypothetical protein
LTPVVDPYDYGVEGSDSPEAQMFLILMKAAYRDLAGVNGTLGMGKSKSGDEGLELGCGCGCGWRDQFRA